MNDWKSCCTSNCKKWNFSVVWLWHHRALIIFKGFTLILFVYNWVNVQSWTMNNISVLVFIYFFERQTLKVTLNDLKSCCTSNRKRWHKRVYIRSMSYHHYGSKTFLKWLSTGTMTFSTMTLSKMVLNMMTFSTTAYWQFA